MAKSNRKGRYIILSSPSGGGKSTIIQRLLSDHPDFAYSISATTRAPRVGEVNGKSYWFLSTEEFEAKLRQGEFMEWEEVYGDYYGTPKRPADAASTLGKLVLFDLDVKGALKLKKANPEVLLIFLMPPSFQILEERLRLRGSEDETHLQKRLELAKWECSQADQFDHIVINNKLEETVNTVERIILQSSIEE